MADAVPFLSPNMKVGYLYQRGYFPAGSITDAHRARLGTMNFHYFLGYARNYRLLAAHGLGGVTTATPDHVFQVIDQDHAVAQLLYRGLRQAEWTLRALAVEHYCSAFAPCGSYLKAQQYRAASAGSEDELVRSIINSVLRHGEPFVDDHITERAASAGCERPRKYDPQRHAELVGYIEDLPLWAVIDSFSLGLLSRFVTQCNREVDRGDVVWRKVADSLEIRHPVFLTNVESLTVIRNQVSHHARMWMRPTTVTPKQPKAFSKELRDSDPKSMMVAFANVALFQGRDSRSAYLEEVLNLVGESALYQYGVTKVRAKTGP